MPFKKKIMQCIKVTHTKLRGFFNIIWHACSLLLNRSVFWKPDIFVWQVVGENVFSRILLFLLPLPKALIHYLCLFLIRHFQMQEEENRSVILLPSNIFNIYVFQNPINCKYGSSSSYGKGGVFLRICNKIA